MSELSALEPREVLLVWIGRLGDFLVATPFLAAARRRWPKARITLVTGDKARDVAARDPNVDERWTLAPAHRAWENLGLAAALLSRRWDLAVDLNPSASRSSGLLVRLSRARERVGFQKRGGGLYTRLIAHDPERGNMVLNYGRLAQTFGAPFEPFPKVYPGPQEREAARALLQSVSPDPAKAWLAFHPGNFKKVQNRWPEDKFIELTRRLQGPGLEVFYFAGPGEEAPVRRMLEKLPGAKLLAPASAVVTAAALASMDLLVTNATGTLYLAAGVGTPTFALLSRYTGFVWSLPEAPHQSIVSEGWSDCRDIPVDKAYAALAPLVEAAKAAPRPKTLA